MDRLGNVPMHQGDDRAGIHTAGKHNADRDVSHDLPTDRLIHQIKRLLGGAYFVERFVYLPGHIPVSPEVDATFAIDFHPVARGYLVDPLERRLRARHIVEGQKVMECLERWPSPDPAIRQDSFD